MRPVVQFLELLGLFFLCAAKEAIDVFRSDLHVSDRRSGRQKKLLVSVAPHVAKISRDIPLGMFLLGEVTVFLQPLQLFPEVIGLFGRVKVSASVAHGRLHHSKELLKPKHI
ncbi:hypothetical protein JYT88_01270 [Rhodospirillaceae bacterium AH-315-P19]|nr:hypothetical protein [Rhodospirillaceae bacterium AH-315-P19]